MIVAYLTNDGNVQVMVRTKLMQHMLKRFGWEDLDKIRRLNRLVEIHKEYCRRANAPEDAEHSDSYWHCDKCNHTIFAEDIQDIKREQQIWE